MSEQQENLDRVSQRIGKAILEYIHRDAPFDFHADDLRDYVISKCGIVAPGSADRILRDLRKKGLLNYVVLSRSKSLYRALPIETQPELWS